MMQENSIGFNPRPNGLGNLDFTTYRVIYELGDFWLENLRLIMALDTRSLIDTRLVLVAGAMAAYAALDALGHKLLGQEAPPRHLMFTWGGLGEDAYDWLYDIGLMWATRVRNDMHLDELPQDDALVLLHYAFNGVDGAAASYMLERQHKERKNK